MNTRRFVFLLFLQLILFVLLYFFPINSSVLPVLYFVTGILTVYLIILAIHQTKGEWSDEKPDIGKICYSFSALFYFLSRLSDYYWLLRIS